MHYHKIKMTAAAMAMAVLVTGNMPAAELNTATVSAKSAISAVLPAAGVGLVLNDGVSVSQIREEIKKRKEEKSRQEQQRENCISIRNQSAASSEIPLFV